MPGIFGFVDHSAGLGGYGDQPELLLRRMADAMQFDPSYTLDMISCPEAGAWVGRTAHPALSAATRGVPSAAGRSPSVKVLLAGEPRSLEADDESDSSEVVAYGTGAMSVGVRYLHHGAESVVSQTAAGVIVDSRAGTCLVFNDRYGAERIFLHVDVDRTFFASEAKAILAVAPQTRELNARGLAEIFACGGTLGRTSLFDQIEVLEGGTVLTFRRGAGMTRRSSFDRTELESAPPADADQFLAEFPQLLRKAVSRCTRRPPAAGVSLTGGLDSRMILAAFEANAETVPCYTFGSMYRDTFDVAIGREVARRTGHPFRVLELGGRFLSNLEKTLDRSVFISDGYIGLSGAAELYLNEQARAIAPVRVTGNWGGELLRGVRAFKFVAPRAGLLQPEVSQQIGDAAREFAATDASISNPLSYTLFRQLPVQGYGRNAIERSQLLMRAPFLNDDVVQALYRAPGEVRRSHAASLAVIGQRRELLEPATDLGLLGDSPSSVRAVRRYYRTGLAKAEYLVSHGAPDWMAVLTANPLGAMLERAFLGHHKFQHFRRWIRRDIPTLLRTSLQDSRVDLSRWLNMPAVRKMVDSHIAGRANHLDELDKALTLTATVRTLLHSSSYDPPPHRESSGCRSIRRQAAPQVTQ
jgi:asparagine synthase (glutamine-hydrolysing)